MSSVPPSASEIARRIRAGEMSAREALDEALMNYDRWNPSVNAVILTRVEDARRRADAADAAQSGGKLWGPLHGVPMTIKESYAWAGTPATFGNTALRSNRPDGTAAAVQRLLDAGAVIYGKTNVPTDLKDSQSFNEIYGTTRNPWALDRTPGGSSGGSAVSVATNMAALELGSDIAGSLRNPAHYSGVLSHKPSWGLVPGAGHQRPGQVADPDIQVYGPMARTAEDLSLAMGVLAGGKYAEVQPRDSLRSYRVAVMLESPITVQHRDLTQHLTAEIERMVGLGLNVTFDAYPDIDLSRSFELHLLLLHAATLAAAPESRLEELRHQAQRFDDGARDRRAYEGKGAVMSHREWYALHNARTIEQRAWGQFFDSYDFLLCPTSQSFAYPHNHDSERFYSSQQIPDSPTRIEALFWALLSGVAYLPSTVIRAGLSTSGLPAGLQIVAPAGKDAEAIAFARLLEREIPHAYAPELPAEIPPTGDLMPTQVGGGNH